MSDSVSTAVINHEEQEPLQETKFCSALNMKDNPDEWTLTGVIILGVQTYSTRVDRKDVFHGD